YTSTPELLGGRVKTIHPAIAAGILARQTDQDMADLQRMGWSPIDLVVVNLYPFEEASTKPNLDITDIIEYIDIGGVTLLRAAAKNWHRVSVVCDPNDYAWVIEKLQSGTLDEDSRRALAHKAFAHTASYDSTIADYLAGYPTTHLRLYHKQTLAYGENPHQKADLFSFNPYDGPLGGKFLQGKELSYNNLLDLDAAWKSVIKFKEPSVVIIKHTSPCGIASATTLADAYQFALDCDPVSAFGSVIGLNRSVDQDTAQAMSNLFIECIIAPHFSPEALEILSAKKNCRLLSMSNVLLAPSYEYRSINHGILRQTLDQGDPTDNNWTVVSRRTPSAQEWESLRFAWKAVQSVKSNAIVLAKGTATVGIGGGQPNRVDSVRIAVNRAGDRARGSVMASDAFFPFPDSISVAAEAGVSAIIHPGGSKRDNEAIAVADQYNIAMVTTGYRHFRH
ncbi:MAG: bifunctional phosphoribosylaminoimidazolecarboxamide formyltransferase/IMP cyclohydrolase, partial [Anaerolineales bacterium]